jgi:hypothetical protein
MKNLADCRYMMRRSLQLLLTDIRSQHIGPVEIDFFPIGITQNNYPEPIRFKAQILLMNLWAALRSLNEHILSLIGVPYVWTVTREIRDSSIIDGIIDWSETLKDWGRGGSKCVLITRKQIESANHKEYVIFVLSEIIIHIEVITNYLMGTLKCGSSSILKTMVDQICYIKDEVQCCLEKVYLSYDSLKIRTLLERARQCLNEIINDSDHAHKPILLKYSEIIRPELPTGSFITDAVKALRNWRDQYLLCNIWLAEKAGLRLQQRGNQAHLYEIWCFMEFAITARLLGIGDIIQHSYIKSSRSTPEMKLADTHYVFYDYRNSRFKQVEVSTVFRGYEWNASALPNVFVEWFIRNIDNYEESIIIDSKYSRWKSGEILKVLGYMLNYGVRNGAIIFRHNYSSELVGISEIMPGLISIDCPGRDKKRLWILNLIPSPNNELINQQILKKFIESVFGGKNNM